MYGVVFSFKDPFDTKDMRTTAGGDAAYDIDFPARDHNLVEQLRSKGAIVFAKAVNTEQPLSPAVKAEARRAVKLRRVIVAIRAPTTEVQPVRRVSRSRFTATTSRSINALRWPAAHRPTRQS